ncbi:MAG: hypothetical protein RLZZ142_2688 [Verrucomicrobiota bacterium]|jgi:arylsulfatase
MRPSVFALFSLALFSGTPFGHADSPAPKRPAPPNVLILLADDLGYSDLGCYGSEIATPHLDSLARNGLRFTQFYNTARCWPSRAAILTGYYAQQVRRDGFPGVPSSVAGNGGTRPEWAPLLPKLLQPAGYHSYHSGKWHIDGTPLKNGFEHSYNVEDHDRYFTPKKHLLDDQPLPPVTPEDHYYATTAIADRAIAQLQQHAQNHPDKPFFEYVAFNAPHFPIQALPEDIARYQSTYEEGWDVLRERRWKQQQQLGITQAALSPLEPEVGPPYPFPQAVQKRGPGEVDRPLPWAQLTPEQRSFQARKMAIHAAMVDRMDREIGRILDQIRAMKAFERTLIFFLSDNGASAEMMERGDGHDPSASPGAAATFLSIGPGWSSLANTPLRRHKTWVHEGGISTPLVAHWPEGIPVHGELRHAPSHIIDLVPTILDAAGIQPPVPPQQKRVPASPGKSLLPFFQPQPSSLASHGSLWWLHEKNRALRVGDWKIVAAGEAAPWELYDLRKDRSELINLASREPQRLQEMVALWEAQTREFRELALRDLPPEALRNEPPRRPRN